MEAFVKASTLLLARWIEAGAALVIAVASVRALGSFLFAIGLLAAIAVLRTALNYFLERELRNAEQRDNAGRPSKRV